MGSNAMVKRVFDELTKLDDIGFKTWISSVRELASQYNIYQVHIETNARK